LRWAGNGRFEAKVSDAAGFYQRVKQAYFVEKLFLDRCLICCFNSSSELEIWRCWDQGSKRRRHCFFVGLPAVRWLILWSLKAVAILPTFDTLFVCRPVCVSQQVCSPNWITNPPIVSQTPRKKGTQCAPFFCSVLRMTSVWFGPRYVRFAFLRRRVMIPKPPRAAARSGKDAGIGTADTVTFVVSKDALKEYG